MKNCKHCNENFVPEHGHQVYCNEDCQKESKKLRRRKGRKSYVVICERCGKESIKFEKHAKYCSEECRSKNENERKLIERRKRDHEPRNCPNCGEVFYKDHSKFIFCSSECREQDYKKSLYENQVVRNNAPIDSGQTEGSKNHKEFLSNPIRYKLQKRVEYSNSKAKKLGIEGRLQQKSLRKLVDELEWKCFYCKLELDHLSITIDHKIPFSRGGKNVIENVVPCCGTCNRRKADKTHLEFKV